MGRRIRKVAFSLWLVTGLALLGLAGVLTCGPRLAAAALVNGVSIGRTQTILAVPADYHIASALAPASVDDLDLLWNAFRLNPASTTIRRDLAYALFSLGKVNEALGVLGDGEGYFLPLETEQRPEVWLLSACVLAQKGQADEAIRQWQRGADLAVDYWSTGQYQLVERAGAKAYQFLLEQLPDRQDWRFLRARLLWLSGQHEEALQQFTILANLTPQTDQERRQVGEALFMLGSSSAQEQPLVAVDYLERALALNPRLIPAYPMLESINIQTGQIGKANSIHERLGILSPQWPVVGGEQEAMPGWMLYGYDLEPQEVEEQPLLRQQLYWRLPAGSMPQGPGWYRAGDHWIQLVESFNLASNAGFEQIGSNSDGATIGYNLHDGTPPSSQQLVLVQRDGALSHVLRQSNTTTGPSVGVWLKPSKITADYYFLVAWVRSTMPQSASGRFEWFDAQGRRLPIENYPFYSSIYPEHVAQVQAVLPGAYSFRFSLFTRTADAEWDNIIIMPIHLLQDLIK
jgi:tetratricopeptide (TPR) repeat protein